MIRELTYTAETRDSKGGCPTYTTSTCKQMCSDIIQAIIVGENVDINNPIKRGKKYEYKGNNITLTTNYKL